MEVHELKAYAEWQAQSGNIRYRDDVIPEGVRARLDAHRQDQFDAVHGRAQAFEFAGRVLRHGVEMAIYYEHEDKKQTRRMIAQLQRYGGDLRMIGYRSWLGLNAHKLYPPLELKALRSVVVYFGHLISKLHSRLAHIVLESGEDTDTFEDTEETAMLSDIIASLEHAHEWLTFQSEQRNAETWEELQVSAETIAAIEGVELQPAPVMGEVTIDGVQRMTTKQAADFLGISHHYLKQMRHYNNGPAYYKGKSGRGNFEEVVYYDCNDILDWLQSKPDTLQKAMHRRAPAAEALQKRELVF